MNSMVLFCFKNVTFAKFIKRELRMNIEFSKTGSDSLGKESARTCPSLVPIRVTCCPVSMSASRGTCHLTNVTRGILNERTGGLFV